jgi:hypothetical protein
MSLSPSTNRTAYHSQAFCPNGAACNTRFFSPNGATYDSLGQRPRFGPLCNSALKGRLRRCFALSGLGIFWDTRPRALPWAEVFCPFGAEEKSHSATRAVQEKQVNANMEGIGYGG